MMTIHSRKVPQLTKSHSTLLIAVLMVLGIAPTTQAAPTCPDPQTRPACGGKVIADPEQSTSFIQYDAEYKPVLDAIEALAPEVVTVKKIGDWIGRPAIKSAGGRDIYVVRLTDESVTAPKRQVAVSLSVHGNESAGREGGLRYIEDIARWWTEDDRDRLLYAGDKGVPLADVMKKTEVYLCICNVDGWASGDHPKPAYSRGNGNGADLNRDYPTLGWTKQDQLQQPETKAWVRLVKSFPRLTTATDIHGELTSATESFSDIMFPAGEWDPVRQAQQLRFAEDMVRTVERKFEEEGVTAETLQEATGDDRVVKPASFATAYDIVGYDDSGFMGDWFVSQGAIELDVENFFSHTVPNNAWVVPLEQAHVAAVKGNVEATIAESMFVESPVARPNIGRVAYAFDPRRVTRTTGEGGGAPYSVSRMAYFEDLEDAAGRAVDRFRASEIERAPLRRYDSLVVADMVNPRGRRGRSSYLRALERFARQGGQLVLTDRAVKMLPRMAAFKKDHVRQWLSNAGHVDFGQKNHPWEKKLSTYASQTYFEVPLGFQARDEAPHWGIKRPAWKNNGGKVVGTVDDKSLVNLGHVKKGKGSIAIFGAILPRQKTTNRHDYGLVNYAPSVAGGQVLHSILGFHRAPLGRLTGPR